MHAGCDFVSSFSHIRKMTALQTLKSKLGTDKYDRIRQFPLLSLVHLLLLHEQNKSGPRVTELQYRMFTKKNLCGDRSPSTLDALVLDVHQKNKIYNIKKNFLFT